MILQDVIDSAKYSELSSVAVKDDITAIILFLNLGMIELYKRFPLKVSEHIVDLVEGETLYDLPEDWMYATAAYGETSETATGEIEEIGINNINDIYSVFIPNHKQIQVPLTAEGAYISLIYVAKPTYYTKDDLAEELDLPETLIECLLHYIGYKAHLGIKGDSQAENNAHWFRFDASCKKARELGVAVPLDPLDMTNRLDDRGFV